MNSNWNIHKTVYIHEYNTERDIKNMCLPSGITGLHIFLHLFNLCTCFKRIISLVAR